MNTNMKTIAIWRQYKSIIGWQKETDQVVSRWLLRLQTDVVELKTCISTEFWANRILETKNREEGEDGMDIAGGDRGERREERGFPLTI